MMESCHLCPEFQCRLDEMFRMRDHLKEVHNSTRLPGHPRKSRWTMTPEEAESHRANLILKLLSSPSHLDSSDTISISSDTEDSIDRSTSPTSPSLTYSPPSPMPSIGEEPDIHLDFLDSDYEPESELLEPESLPSAPEHPPSPCSVPALQVVPDSPEGTAEPEEEPQEQEGSGPQPRAVHFRFVTIQVSEATVYF